MRIPSGAPASFILALLAIPSIAVSLQADDVSNHQPEVAMEKEAMVALNQMVDAVNAGDAGRYASVYAENAVITIFGGAKLVGRNAIEQYEVGLLRDYPGTRFVFCSIWLKGEVVVANYAVNGPGPPGKSTGHEGLLFFRFDSSGQIVEEHRYLDSFTPMAQLGLRGNAPARPVPALPSEPAVYRAGQSEVEKSNVAIVAGCLSKIDSKNRAAFLRSLADDITVDELVDREPGTGKGAGERWFSTWTAQAPDLASKITSITAVGDFVLVQSEPHGTLNGALGAVHASQRPFLVHCGLIFEVKDGKITLIRNFMNSKELAEQVGQWPPKGNQQSREIQ